MTDLAVIILTKNEHLHIGRCLDKLVPLSPRQIFVVDCFSTDDTKSIVENFAAALKLQRETPTINLIEHEWPGNQAAQFNWALDNLPIMTSWILRLDADEYLFDNTIVELKQLLPIWNGEEVVSGVLPPDTTSLSLSLARYFCGRRIRWGVRDIELVRLFKKGVGRSSQSEMDERIVTDYGVNRKLHGRFVDHSLISFDDWRLKHFDYAKREARMAVSGRMNKNKRIYYMMPPYFRAIAYFLLRYFVGLGFLDGAAGLKWNFWQGLWYRWIVDREIGKMKSQPLNVQK